jgi:hypothetical protein
VSHVRIGCLNVYSGVRTSRHQPIDRGHHDHRPSGTSPARRTGPGNFRMRLGRLCVTPVERRAVDPDAVKDDGDLAGNGDLRLLHTYPLCELHSPGLKGGPFFGPIKQNGRRLEQVSSEKPVAPSRYLTSYVSFPRLVAPRGKAEIGADCRGRSEAGRVINRMAER